MLIAYPQALAHQLSLMVRRRINLQQKKCACHPTASPQLRELLLAEVCKHLRQSSFNLDACQNSILFEFVVSDSRRVSVVTMKMFVVAILFYGSDMS